MLCYSIDIHTRSSPIPFESESEACEREVSESGMRETERYAREKKVCQGERERKGEREFHTPGAHISRIFFIFSIRPPHALTETVGCCTESERASERERETERETERERERDLALTFHVSHSPASSGSTTLSCRTNSSYKQKRQKKARVCAA